MMSAHVQVPSSANAFPFTLRPVAALPSHKRHDTQVQWAVWQLSVSQIIPGHSDAIAQVHSPPLQRYIALGTPREASHLLQGPTAIDFSFRLSKPRYALTAH